MNADRQVVFRVDITPVRNGFRECERESRLSETSNGHLQVRPRLGFVWLDRARGVVTTPIKAEPGGLLSYFRDSGRQRNLPLAEQLTFSIA